MSPTKLAAKGARFVGPGEASVMKHVSPQFGEWCAQLFKTITDGKVNVRIHDTYPLSEIVRVHQDLEGRKTMGKVLVKP